jgi:hypothetical protein
VGCWKAVVIQHVIIVVSMAHVPETEEAGTAVVEDLEAAG